jgi:trk system potassium uptake protein TrkH
VGYSLRRFLWPRSVEKLRIGDELVSDSQVSAALALVLIWFFLLIAGTLVLLIDARLDAQSAFSACLSMMSTTGPGFPSMILADGQWTAANAAQINIGPYGGYGDLSGFSQFTLTFLMVVGRLEVYTVAAIFAPAFWRRM